MADLHQSVNAFAVALKIQILGSDTGPIDNTRLCCTSKKRLPIRVLPNRPIRWLSILRESSIHNPLRASTRIGTEKYRLRISCNLRNDPLPGRYTPESNAVPDPHVNSALAAALGRDLTHMVHKGLADARSCPTATCIWAQER